ncbi:Methyl-CpG-binding domain protein 5 [Sarracenia purpurea var. burkii]
MSNWESPGGPPNPPFHLPESDVLFADDHHIPPDPLLKSGTFIEADLEPTEPTPTGSERAQNGISDHEQTNRTGAREPELRAHPAAGVPSYRNDMTTSATQDAESTPTGRKGASVAGVSFESLPERPKWLPEGWRIDYRVRSSGATAGSVDRYYVEPKMGYRFRSKIEVDYFLQTGSKRKKKPTPDADVNPSENPGGSKQEKSGSKKKKSAPLNFDFNSVPEKVRWVLTEAVKDQWTPFVGGKVVPHFTRQDWNAAFHFSCK